MPPAAPEPAPGAAELPPALRGLSRGRILRRLFLEYFRISLFVVGGGYAIIAAADEAFGRRLKWLREGELLEHLPVFQMIPGLIAGNSAIYVGLRAAGIAGVATALVAVALPSFLVILAIAFGYSGLPMDRPWIQGAFLGLRSALTGIVAATMLASWPRVMRGAYAHAAFAAALVALLGAGASPARVLVAGMLLGVAWEGARALLPRRRGDAAAPPAPAPGRARDVLAGLWPAALLAVALAVASPTIFPTFVKFGLLCFGGGNVLVPVYTREFVGPDAPLLRLTPEDFGNLLGITQVTPGPISVNAATFFGYRLAGAAGSLAATIGLLLPSFFLMVVALRSLDRWRRNPVVKGLLWGVAPATVALMAVAALLFARMSVFDGPLSPDAVLDWALRRARPAGEAFRVRPAAVLLAAGSAWALFRGRARIMPLMLGCAALGALVFPPLGN